MSTQTSITKLHIEHIEWLNKLLFYKDDLKIMQHRLEEVAAKNNSKECLIQVEHFQNQFKIQNEQIDILKHEIKQDESLIEKSISDNPVASDHRKLQDNGLLRVGMLRFEELFAAMRKELMTFLSKWM
jgi:hypothetical protein